MSDEERTSSVTVERLGGGLYRLRDTEKGGEVMWNPSRGPLRRVRFPRSSFKYEALRLDLGVACADCGYLSFEHYIDGDEKAPCAEFTAPPTDTTKGQP